MRTFPASLVLAALVAGPALAAPFNANINKDGPHVILPRKDLQSSQPLQAASSSGSQAPSIELPVTFQPIGPAVPVSKREPVPPVSFIPVGAALDGTDSAPPADTAPADTAVETASASAPASSSTAAPVGTRPVSFIPVGAALGNNAKRQPVQNPPFVPPGTFGGVPPASPSATESAPVTSQSASTGVRPVSFIPVNGLEGADTTTSKRASTIHSVSFIPEGALNANVKRIVDPTNTLPVNSPIDYAGVQKRQPVRGPASFIPVSALTGAQRQARRQEASAIPSAGSAPGTVPASITYPAGQSGAPMMYMFREEGSVVAMPAASGTV